MDLLAKLEWLFFRFFFHDYCKPCAKVSMKDVRLFYVAVRLCLCSASECFCIVANADMMHGDNCTRSAYLDGMDDGGGFPTARAPFNYHRRKVVTVMNVINQNRLAQKTRTIGDGYVRSPYTAKLDLSLQRIRHRCSACMTINKADKRPCAGRAPIIAPIFVFEQNVMIWAR